MSTKVFLHGGYASTPNEQNNFFFKDILSGTGSVSKILLVLFSKEPEKVQENMNEDIAQFERNKDSKFPTYELAYEETFISQIKEADIIYFHGGNTLKLLDTLKKFPNLKELFKDKIVAAESAGVYALSAYFHSERAGGTYEGIGLMPIKTICHFTPEKAGKLADAPKELEEVCLKDFEYKVFEY